MVDRPMSAVVINTYRVSFIRRDGSILRVVMSHEEDGIGISICHWVSDGGNMTAGVVNRCPMNEERCAGADSRAGDLKSTGAKLKTGTSGIENRSASRANGELVVRGTRKIAT